MGSPTEHRELMRANFRFNETRSVEEVIAAQKARHATPNAPTKGKRQPVRPPAEHGIVRREALDEMNALLARGRAAQVEKG